METEDLEKEPGPWKEERVPGQETEPLGGDPTPGSGVDSYKRGEPLQ